MSRYSALHAHWLELSPGERATLADRVGVSLAQFRNLVYASNGRRIMPDMAIRIEKATRGAVRCEEMCPWVDWAFIRATK